MSDVPTGFTREKVNPIQVIRNFWPDATTDHITYDPHMRKNGGQFVLTDKSGGDGTLLFTLEMFDRLLLPIVKASIYYKPTAPQELINEPLKYDLHYTIGPIRHYVVFGRIELNCSDRGQKYPGQRERAKLPVKVEYFKKP